MAIRDALLNDSYPLINTDGFEEETDLTIIPWTRATVADGQWLQDHAIGPLSARDVYLADQIEGNAQAIDGIKASLTDIGILGSGTAGSTLLNAGAVKTINYKLYGNNSEANWASKPATIVPSGESDVVAPAYSLTYLSVGPQTEDLGGVSVADGYGAIVQSNMKRHVAGQLLMNGKKLYYRFLSNPQPSTMPGVGNLSADVTYDNSNPSFKIIPVLNNTNIQNGEYAIKYDNDGFSLTDIQGATVPITNANANWFSIDNNKILNFRTDNVGLSASGTKFFLTTSGFAKFDDSSYAKPSQIQTYTFASSGGLSVDNNEFSLSLLGNEQAEEEKTYVAKCTTNDGRIDSISWVPLVPETEISTASSSPLSLSDGNVLEFNYNPMYLTTETYPPSEDAAEVTRLNVSPEKFLDTELETGRDIDDTDQNIPRKAAFIAGSAKTDGRTIYTLNSGCVLSGFDVILTYKKDGEDGEDGEVMELSSSGLHDLLNQLYEKIDILESKVKQLEMKDDQPAEGT